jgi:hypothetical protein
MGAASAHERRESTGAALLRSARFSGSEYFDWLVLSPESFSDFRGILGVRHSDAHEAVMLPPTITAS